MPTRRFSLLAVALLVLLVKPASAGRGKGHCGHQGTGTGHQGDDCGESTPTPTPTPTPVPTSTATPVPTPTPTPVCNCPTRTLVWKDATGLTVEGAFSMHPMSSTLGYADANGYFWTLELSNLVVYQSFAETEFFESFDCTGPAYMRLDVGGYRNPRVVFRLVADPNPESPTFYVFPDDIAAVTINARSIKAGPSCGSWNSPGMNVYPMSERIVVPRPVLNGLIPPLHAEFE